MAKKSYQRHASGNEGELTYFCLITMTEKGRMRSKSATSGDRASTTKAVRDAGGKCRLYTGRRRKMSSLCDDRFTLQLRKCNDQYLPCGRNKHR